MAQEVQPGQIGEIRTASTQGGGSAITGTSQVISFPTGTRYVSLFARNFASSAAVVEWALCPSLIVLKTTDALVAVGNLTDYTVEVQDALTTTVATLDSLDTAANNDFVYVGSYDKFSGVDVNHSGSKVNGTTSVLTVKYWNGSVWGDISDTDGTIAGGATFAVDGQVTWTVPSDWAADSLFNIGDTTLTATWLKEPTIYWTRWEVSVALDAEVEIDHMIGLRANRSLAELVSSAGMEFMISEGPGGISGVEALTNTGTANFIVNVATAAVGRRFVN